MASKKKSSSSVLSGAVEARASSPVEELLLAALERGGDSLETGRLLITFKEGAGAEGTQALEGRGMRVASAHDFDNQAAVLESVGDAGAFVFPEIGVALVGGGSALESNLSVAAEIASDSPIESIDPEYFVFSQGIDPNEFMSGFAQSGESNAAEYLRGFVSAAQTIARDLRGEVVEPVPTGQEEVTALGATWGLNACKVPSSPRSGAGIKLAVLDTGMDLGHPDFAGRTFVSETFVGQPVQDLHSHGTHCVGTACGPKAPAGSTPRYGIGYRTTIFVGKVLANSGSSVGGSVLAGMNWAIANRCEVISMSLGSQSGVNPYYTAAGQAALNSGCLIIAASGNAGSLTGSPANSPTIMSVGALNPNLTPWAFSNFGKVEIAGPGVNVYSSVPRPNRYGTKTGTSMATPHVAGCAALWAETSPTLRGLSLWNRLRATAKSLPFPASRVGAGLVQAPQ